MSASDGKKDRCAGRSQPVRKQDRREADRPGPSQEDRIQLSWHLDNSSLAVVLWDAEGRILRWSSRAEEVFGWTARETEGRSWGDWRFVHEDDAAAVERRIGRLYRGEERYNVSENRNYTKSGEMRYCRWFNSTLRDEEGNLCSILSQIDDISHYKFDEFRYRGVFENMPDGLAVYRWDRERGDFVFSDFNPSAERITKVSKAGVVGRPLLECFPRMDEFGLVQALRQVLETGRPMDMEPRWYEDRTRRGWRENRIYRLPSGEVTAIFADVTRRMQTESELREAKTRAEDASRAKSEFLANMSHEIRTPLNGVVGVLQLLQTTGMTEEQESYVRTALQSSLRLTRLLGDILDISRIEAGRLVVTRERFRLALLCGSIQELFSPSAAEKGLSLECAMDPAVPPELLGDPVRLQQVLFNLVGNAVKFSSQGRVRVAVFPLSAPAGRARLLFVVSDTGIGIPDEELGTLFEPFTQVEREFTRNYEGAGLGLSIVKRLVDLMGGQAAVDSEVGRGTDVYVSLPFDLPENCEADLPAPKQGTARPSGGPDRTLLARDPEEAYETEADLPSERPDPAEPGDPARPLQGLRVLLAEDDHVNRLAVTRLLERSGAEVQTAADGEECLKLLQFSERPLPHAVLMDIQMPRLNGREALKRLRDLPDTGAAGLPVVALTAHAMHGDRERLLAHGFDGYLSKPVVLKELVRELGRLTSGAAGPGGSAA
jgi:PAS domain S-box-containing protein